MTIELQMPRELEDRLRREAARRGEATDAAVLRVLDENLPLALDARRTAALATLDRMMKEVAEMTDEEFAENAAVLRALDEDRPSYRKLFADLLPSEAQ